MADRFFAKAEIQMKNAPLILACAAGLAAGAFVGSRDHRALPAASSASDADVHGNSTGADARMDRALAFSSDDARITRLFSALREPIALKKRAELFEALQDLSAQDLPGLVKHAEGLSFMLRREVLPILVERWFAVDFDAAQNWMRAHPREYSAVKAWAQANPEAAIQEALANPKGSRSQSSIFIQLLQLNKS